MSNENPDGLRYPSIDELLKVIDSKYKLAYTAAKRAKIIKAEKYSSMEELGGNIAAKPVGMALEEIANNKIQIEFVDSSLEEVQEEKHHVPQSMNIESGDDEDDATIKGFEEL